MMAVITPSTRIVEVHVYLIRAMNFIIWIKLRRVAKKQHEMYIMEGFMDVIAAYRAGIENAVASMGTAIDTMSTSSTCLIFTKKGHFDL